MKKKLLFCLLIVISGLSAFSQTEQFDIASFIAPKGWQRLDSNNTMVLHDYRTSNGLTSFCQIFLYPSVASNLTPQKNFQEEWTNKVVNSTGTKAKPATETEKTPDGWTAVKGAANLTVSGITYTCILVTASGFGKTMSIMINVAGQDYLADIDNFLNHFELDKDAKPMVKTNTNVNTPSLEGLNNYDYIAPEGWYSYKTNNGTILSQYQTLEYGCLVTVYPPEPSSGNLETDVKTIFNKRYGAWEFRSTGENHDHLSKGYTPQGLEYCMMEADMKKVRPDGYYYDYEDAAVWVIGLGKQIAVVTGQHNRNMACFCNQKYEYWRRFFNSFIVKNQTPANNVGEDVSKRIVGDWMSIGGSALNEYLFAANGNYQYIGAYATTTKTSNAYYEYTHIKTSSFKGDGAYTIKGNQLTFTKYNSKNTEQVEFRFEKVNHGSTGWKDRLYMLNNNSGLGKYEVCYEKTNR